MWPRVVEVLFGFWLFMSPFIFRHDLQQTSLWVTDFACGFTAIVLGLLAFWRRTRAAHLANVGAAMLLIGIGYFGAPHPAPPAFENYIIVGLMLLMFAIIPNHANVPSQAWREFYAESQNPQ